MGRSITPIVPRSGYPLVISEITASISWIAPAAGFVDILVFGAGGSGGVALGLSSSAQRALGGNAGGACYKRKAVAAGETLTFTMGAGGAGRSTAGGNTAGLAGGTTTVTGPSLSLSIPGGAGGLSVESTAAVNPTAATAPTGGDFNLTGGLGGAIAANTALVAMATGGGSPRIEAALLTNGGAITAGPAGNAATGGGGFRSAGVQATTATATAAGGGQSSFGVQEVIGYFIANAAGGAGVSGLASSAISGFGGGSGGCSNSGGSATSGTAVFGGSGGAVSNGSTSGSGNVTWCGGSGGSAANTANVTSGKGGDAFAIVAFYSR